MKSESYLGDKNPNFKHERDLSCIYDLSPEGAYILGLIYSDGHIEDNKIDIYQHRDYKVMLSRISQLLFNQDLVTENVNGICVLSINDKRLVDFVLSLGGTCTGKKSSAVSLPNIPEDKIWPFICGFFDGDGGFHYNYRYPSIRITSNSPKMLEGIAKHWEVNYSGHDTIEASGYKALDICGKMYESCKFYHPKKKLYYEDILNWEPLPSGPWLKDSFFKCKKFSPEARIPEKSRVTDSGYDLHAVDLQLDEKTGLYIADTRLAVEPIPGHYFDLIGRSSLPKNGFHFVGGVGIIDRSYVGSIKMYLQKIGDSADSVVLPFKCGQLIPRKIFHVQFVEVDELGESDRGDGGFGSTGQ